MPFDCIFGVCNNYENRQGILGFGNEQYFNQNMIITPAFGLLIFVTVVYGLGIFQLLWYMLSEHCVDHGDLQHDITTDHSLPELVVMQDWHSIAELVSFGFTKDLKQLNNIQSLAIMNNCLCQDQYRLAINTDVIDIVSKRLKQSLNTTLANMEDVRSDENDGIEIVTNEFKDGDEYDDYDQLKFDYGEWVMIWYKLGQCHPHYATFDKVWQITQPWLNNKYFFWWDPAQTGLLLCVGLKILKTSINNVNHLKKKKKNHNNSNSSKMVIGNEHFLAILDKIWSQDSDIKVSCNHKLSKRECLLRNKKLLDNGYPTVLIPNNRELTNNIQVFNLNEHLQLLRMVESECNFEQPTQFLTFVVQLYEKNLSLFMSQFISEETDFKENGQKNRNNRDRNWKKVLDRAIVVSNLITLINNYFSNDPDSSKLVQSQVLAESKLMQIVDRILTDRGEKTDPINNLIDFAQTRLCLSVLSEFLSKENKMKRRIEFMSQIRFNLDDMTNDLDKDELLAAIPSFTQQSLGQVITESQNVPIEICTSWFGEIIFKQIITNWRNRNNYKTTKVNDVNINDTKSTESLTSVDKIFMAEWWSKTCQLNAKRWQKMYNMTAIGFPINIKHSLSYPHIPLTYENVSFDIELINCTILHYAVFYFDLELVEMIFDTMLQIVGIEVITRWIFHVDMNNFNILHYIVFRSPYGHVDTKNILNFVSKFCQDNNISHLNKLWQKVGTVCVNL